MGVESGQQYNVGEKPTVIPYTNINHHATEAKDTMNLDTDQFCYIGSGIGWLSNTIILPHY